MIESIISMELPAGGHLAIRRNRICPEQETKQCRRISLVSGIHGDELEGQYICYEIEKTGDRPIRYPPGIRYHHGVLHVGGDRYVGIILYGKRGAAVLPIVRGCFRLEYRRLEYRLYPSPHPYRENHHYQHDAGRTYRGIGLPRKFLQGIHEKELHISTRKYINVKIR